MSEKYSHIGSTAAGYLNDPLKWPSVADALEANKFAGGASDVAAYTISTSLSTFFLRRGSYETLLNFGLEGKATGDWDAALQKYYQIPNTAELQRQWKQWVVDGLMGRGDSRIAG